MNLTEIRGSSVIEVYLHAPENLWLVSRRRAPEYRAEKISGHTRREDALREAYQAAWIELQDYGGVCILDQEERR